MQKMLRFGRMSRKLVFKKPKRRILLKRNILCYVSKREVFGNRPLKTIPPIPSTSQFWERKRNKMELGSATERLHRM